MRTVIIDDEFDAVDSLNLIIKNYLPGLKIVGTFTDSSNALLKLPSLKPDLVFLDINMPVLNGFELLERLGKINFNIIFTTAYDNYAIKAFKIGAVNYLLKPIDIDELITAVNRLSESKVKDQLKSGLLDGKIVVSSIDGLHFLNPNEIFYLESDLTYVYIYVNSKKIQVRVSLKDLEFHLPAQFVRVHNSYIVNIHHIRKLVKADQWTIELINSAVIPVARRKRSEFQELIEQMIGKSIE